ncbi:MAG: S8 family serine peptidase [Marinicellaceae bacterium]
MNIIKVQILLFMIINTSQSFANHKLSSELNKQIKLSDKVEIYVLLKNQKPLKPFSGTGRIEKLKHTIQQLKNNAQYSQTHIKPLLSSLTNEYKFYWINNSFWATIDSDKINTLTQSKHIKKAFSNQKQKLDTIQTTTESTTNSARAIEWNISHINAPQVWELGIKGQNVLVAGQDTGYQWDHKSIKNQYAGWDGVTVNHNYAWHDAISNPLVDCLDEAQKPASCDDHGHGTHTMGTIVGDDAQGNQIGVAPESKWIGCRNMDIGNGTPATYTECFQFFLEPTDIQGLNPNVNKAPHIINNSWGCPVSEGCIEANALESVVNNVVDAGILVVVSAGNSGPSCNSVVSPAAIYHKSLTIGSITVDDEISSFSSQGAVTVDGSNRIKPDIVAPGSSIRSAALNGDYSFSSGTSMAGPHVAGLAALMISANPEMAGKPKILKHVILRSSQALSTQQTCSGVLGSAIPNNTFGWGKIDALSAVNDIKDLIFLDNYEDF